MSDLKPVAYMHNNPSRFDVIHTEVKELLQRAAKEGRPISGGLHRPVDTSEHYTIQLYSEFQLTTLQQKLEAAEQRVRELEAAAFALYNSGYERGHHHTVEGHYAPPKDYPEEFPEVLDEHLRDLYPLPNDV